MVEDRTGSSALADSVETGSQSLIERLQEFVGKPYGTPTIARDPVNLPMIRHLTDALDDRNPVYTDEAFAEKSVHGGIVAPPTSLQVWTMQGLAGRRSAEPDPDDTQGRLMQLFEDHGYIGVVATNCEQTYHRYLRPGDLLTVSSELESIVGPKRTALGEGYFVTTLQKFRDQDDQVVGEMRFRILKFIPANVRTAGDGEAEADAQGDEEPSAGELPIDFPPPPLDERFFWEGLEDGELRIQRCGGCGTLRHPPRPICPQCRSFEWDYVVASGDGEVSSYVIHHHPPVPNREHPFAVVLVELAEGTRILGNAVDVDDVHIGMPVEVAFVKNHQGRTLAQWRPRAGGGRS